MTTQPSRYSVIEEESQRGQYMCEMGRKGGSLDQQMEPQRIRSSAGKEGGSIA